MSRPVSQPVTRRGKAVKGTQEIPEAPDKPARSRATTLLCLLLMAGAGGAHAELIPVPVGGQPDTPAPNSQAVKASESDAAPAVDRAAGVIADAATTVASPPPTSTAPVPDAPHVATAPTPEAVPTTPTSPETAVPVATANPDGRVTLTIRLPERVKALSLAVSGVEIVAGSSLIGDEALADPVPDGTRSIWQISNPGTELHLSFQTASGDAPLDNPEIAVLYDTGLTETLSGTLKYRPAVSADMPAPLRDGLIRSPEDGRALWGRDSVNVLTRSEYQAELVLTVNGEVVPSSRIGRQVDDPNTNETTREFIGVPLQVGPNTIEAVSGGQMDTVQVKVAGSAQGLRLLSSDAVADGFRPIRLTVEVTDKAGLRAVVPTLTVEDTGHLNLLTPDADPGQSGHQIKVVDGRAELSFSPRSTVLDAEVRFNVNGHSVPLKVQVLPQARRTAIGVASATLRPGASGLKVDGDAHLTLETPLGGGQLTVNVDSSGAHTDTPAETRHPSLGDSGESMRPLEADGPFAARYDHPALTALYARNAGFDPLFGRPDDGDTMNVTGKGQTQFTGYLAPYANDSQEVTVVMNGTRVATLPAPLDPQRARLFLRTVDSTGLFTEIELQRGQDFVTDEAGIISFARAMPPQVDLNTTITLIARGPTSTPQLAPAGLLAVTRHYQVGEVDGMVTVGLHASRTNASQGNLTGGVRWQASDVQGPDTFNADVLAAVSGTGASRAQVQVSGQARGTTYALTAQHESAGYDGPAATGQAGETLTASASRQFTPVYGAKADLRLKNDLKGFGSRAALEGTYTPSPNLQVNAGVFVGLGTLEGVGLSGGLNYKSGPWTTVLGAQQNFTTNSGQYGAQLTRRVPLPAYAPPGTELSVGLRANALLSGGMFSLSTSTALIGRAGPYTALLEYAVPSVSAEQGQLRGNVQATFPIMPNLNLAVQAGLSPLGQQFSAEMRLNKPGAVATAGLDIARSNADGALSSAARFSVSRTVTPAPTPLGLTADGLCTFGPDGNGHRYSVGVTYRGEDLSVAAYARWRAGTLTTTRSGQEITGELDASRTRLRGQERLGLALKALPGDPQGLTWQGVAATRTWVTSKLALGAAYRALYQPGSQTFVQALGLEGTYRVLPQAGLTLGYNLGGFDSLTAEPTTPGLYLRLDVMLDELTRWSNP